MYATCCFVNWNSWNPCRTNNHFCWAAKKLAQTRIYTTNRTQEIKLEVINQVYPTEPGQMEKMAGPGPEGPIVMVNLLKFKDKAEYRDGRETDLTGRQAYDIYSRAVTQLIQEFGGRIFFAADVTALAVGLVEDLWDEVALAEYPDRAAMAAMTSSEAWRDIAVHREAGLEGQLNLETIYNSSAANTPQNS